MITALPELVRLRTESPVGAKQARYFGVGAVHSGTCSYLFPLSIGFLQHFSDVKYYGSRRVQNSDNIHVECTHKRPTLSRCERATVDITRTHTRTYLLFSSSDVVRRER